MNGIALEVNGIPTNLIPDDRMVDKLTIHFLRPRNSGGEVNRVLFPSDRSGQAFLIFEEPEVAARVLKATHVLELEKHKYPLSLKEADRPEVDLPVEASLDIRMFPNISKVRHIVESHDLKVIGKRRDEWRVQGSFLQLREAKAQLLRLLPQDTPPAPGHPTPEPLPSLNGHAHLSGAIAKSTSRKHYDTRSNSMRAGSQSQAMLALPSSLSTPPVATESAYRANPSPKSTASVSFMTNPDVLRYAQIFKKNDIDLIMGKHGSSMSVKSTEDAEFTQVTLEGGASRNAMGKLQGLLAELSPMLRTQDIPLGSFDHDSQVKIGKRILEYKPAFPSVLVEQVGQTIHMVGPSIDSYELKQRILGERTDGQLDRGRTPGERRRSSSQPRTGGNWDPNPQPRTGVNWDSTPNPTQQGYSPINYQGDVGSAGARAGSRAESRTGARQRSSSEGREQERGRKAQRMQELVPSGGYNKSPLEKKQKWPAMQFNFNTKDMLDKLRRNKKT